MSSRNKRTFYALVTALAIAVAVFMARRPASGRLLDGSEVVLRKVSYGTNHTAPHAPLESLLRRLPANWSETIHWKPSSGEQRVSGRSVFTFWLEFSKPPTETQPLGYAIADENGFEALMTFTGPYGSYSPGGFSRNRVGFIRGSGTFPHRTQKFFLRLYQQDGSGKRVRVAEFLISNAGFREAPEWTPQPLPIEHETNGLVFSLLNAKVGVSPPGPLVAPYALQAGQWSEFRFRVSRQGQPSAGWTINEMVISDAAGNRLRVSGEDTGAFNAQFSRMEGDEIVCLHRWCFWSENPAWKLSIHFEQGAEKGYWIEYLVRPDFLK